MAADKIISAVKALVRKIRRHPQNAMTCFTVVTEMTGDLQTSTEIKNFTKIKTDEPMHLGGTNKAPTPGEILLAALGSCQATTISGYAITLGIKLDKIRVITHGDIDMRGMMAFDYFTRPGFSKISLLVEIESSEPEHRLKEISVLSTQHCPLLDTIANPVSVECQTFANNELLDEIEMNAEPHTEPVRLKRAS